MSQQALGSVTALADRITISSGNGADGQNTNVTLTLPRDGQWACKVFFVEFDPQATGDAAQAFASTFNATADGWFLMECEAPMDRSGAVQLMITRSGLDDCTSADEFTWEDTTAITCLIRQMLEPTAL